MKSFVIVLIAACIVGSFCAVRREAFVCKAGKSYIQNQCNDCVCIQADDLVCTAKRCPLNNDLENCNTGATWQEGCNKCWCTNAGTICTATDCNQ